MNKSRIAVSLFFGVNGFLFANYVSRLPDIQSAYGLDNGSVGMVLLASALGALIAMPFTGWLIVGKGSKQVSRVGGLLFCLSIPLIAMMPNAWTLGMFFFVMGLVTGTMDVAMNAQAVVVEQKFKRPIMSNFHAIFSAGMMAGAGSGALFTHFDLNLINHLLIVSLLGFLSLAWAVRHLIPDEGKSTKKEKSPFRLPEASLIGVGLIAFCCMLGEGAMANWSTNYMLNIAGAASAFAPMGLAVFSMAMMIARFWGDRVRVKLGDRLLLITSSLISVMGLGLVLLLPHPWVVLFGLLLVGLGLSVIVPVAYSTAGNVPDLSPGVGIGMVTTIGYAGFLLGPPVIGLLADWQDLRIALVFTLLLFTLMTWLSFRFRPVRS